MRTVRTRALAAAWWLSLATYMGPTMAWASVGTVEAAAAPSLGASALKALAMLLILGVGSLVLKRVVRRRWSGALHGGGASSSSVPLDLVVGTRTRLSPGVELVAVHVWGEEVLLSVSAHGAQVVLRRNESGETLTIEERRVA